MRRDLSARWLKRGSSLLLAARTSAAVWLDKRVYILLAVVVGNLVTFVDGFFGKQEDATLDDACFGIGATGVIRVSGDVVA